MNEKLPFLVIGHRGCAGVEPENTLRSIQRALEVGCEMVEIDVHSVAGVLLVHHDERVDRTSDGVGALGDYTFDALRQLDVGMGEVIPVLEEVLDLCLGKSVVNIELKGALTAAPVVALLEEREGGDRVILSSFDWSQLKEARRLSSVPLAVLVAHEDQYTCALELAEELAATWVNVAIKVVSKARVLAAHERGIQVACYTVKTIEELRAVLSAKADACFADDPEFVLSYVAST